MIACIFKSILLLPRSHYSQSFISWLCTVENCKISFGEGWLLVVTLRTRFAFQEFPEFFFLFSERKTDLEAIYSHRRKKHTRRMRNPTSFLVSYGSLISYRSLVTVARTFWNSLNWFLCGSQFGIFIMRPYELTVVCRSQKIEVAISNLIDQPARN